MGTFYQWLDRVLPFDMMRYQAVVNYTLIVTMIFYGVMAGFFVLCLRRGAGQIRYIILFFTIFMVPFSAAHFNFWEAGCLLSDAEHPGGCAADQGAGPMAGCPHRRRRRHDSSGQCLHVSEYYSGAAFVPDLQQQREAAAVLCYSSDRQLSGGLRAVSVV